METVRLSDAQTEVIKKEEFYENTSINNIAGIITIKEDLKLETIENAMNNIINQNDSYKIRITKVNSEYRQYVDEYKRKQFDYIDFTNDKEGYDQWIKQQVKKNIFATDSELFEFTILKLPDANIGIFSLHHHIISDGWSTTLGGNALCEYLIYGIQEETSEFSYLDSVNDELNYKNSHRFEKDKQFWYEKLKGFENNELFKNKLVTNGQGSRQSYVLSENCTQKIKEFCESNKMSISNLFSAAMLILKHKKTASNKNSVGLLVHNRNEPFEKNIIGVYARILPVIVDIDKNASINHFLTTVKTETFNLLKHRKYSYKEIVENNGNKKGLLDCTVSFQKTQYNSDFVEKGYSDEWFSSDTHNVPLGLNISNRNGNSMIDIDYNYQTDIMNEAEVMNLHKDIMGILNVVIETPNKAIKDIAIYTDRSQ